MSQLFSRERGGVSDWKNSDHYYYRGHFSILPLKTGPKMLEPAINWTKVIFFHFQPSRKHLWCSAQANMSKVMLMMVLMLIQNLECRRRCLKRVTMWQKTCWRKRSSMIRYSGVLNLGFFLNCGTGPGAFWQGVPAPSGLPGRVWLGNVTKVE